MKKLREFNGSAESTTLDTILQDTRNAVPEDSHGKQSYASFVSL